MTLTDDLGTMLCERDLPAEFWRLNTSTQIMDDMGIVSMLSGTIPDRQNSEAICPLMVQRRLVVPLLNETLSDLNCRIA